MNRLSWSNEEIAYLKKYYPTGGAREVQKYVNRHLQYIRIKASSLGIFYNNKIRISSTNIKATQTDKAYLAGIFDGEGYVEFRCINNKTKTLSFHAIITNTHLGLLEYIKNLYGGYISKHTKPKYFYTQCYAIKLNIPESINFYQDILPYSIIKKTKIRYALDIRKKIFKNKLTIKQKLELVEEFKAIGNT